MKCHPTLAEKHLNKALQRAKKRAKREWGASIMLFNRQVLKCGYILDFYFLRARLAVEVDGPYHSSPKQRRYDKRRDAVLAKADIKTLRFTNDEVLNSTERVVDEIYAEVKRRWRPLHGRRY